MNKIDEKSKAMDLLCGYYKSADKNQALFAEYCLNGSLIPFGIINDYFYGYIRDVNLLRNRFFKKVNAVNKSTGKKLVAYRMKDNLRNELMQRIMEYEKKELNYEKN